MAQMLCIPFFNICFSESLQKGLAHLTCIRGWVCIVSTALFRPASSFVILLQLQNAFNGNGLRRSSMASSSLIKGYQKCYSCICIFLSNISIELVHVPHTCLFAGYINAAYQQAMCVIVLTRRKSKRPYAWYEYTLLIVHIYSLQNS